MVCLATVALNIQEARFLQPQARENLMRVKSCPGRHSEWTAANRWPDIAKKSLWDLFRCWL
jgi:hypothetical protein